MKNNQTENQTRANDQITTCPECQQVLPKIAKNCFSCGAEQVQETEPCANCGFETQVSSKFCPSCGTHK